MEYVMSVELFRERLNRSRLHPNDIKWMPSWFSQFAAGRPVVDGLVWFDTDDVLKFLQKLRDAKVECWQRLQAARSLEWYQMMVLRVSTVDFTEFLVKQRVHLGIPTQPIDTIRWNMRERILQSANDGSNAGRKS